MRLIGFKIVLAMFLAALVIEGSARVGSARALLPGCTMYWDRVNLRWYCSGACPVGEDCEQLISYNADGSVNSIYCACV